MVADGVHSIIGLMHLRLESKDTVAGIKAYILECCRQAPLSWRRGAVVMTILISLALIGGLALGWHQAAYPTSIFLMGTAAITAFDVLAIFPYQLWKANMTEIVALRERLKPKVSCRAIEVKLIDDRYHCRVAIENESSTVLSGLTAYLESIVADDVLQQVATIDFPVQLYTQEELKVRIGSFDGWQPVLPFNLRGNQRIWIEVFQISEPFAWHAHLLLSNSRVDFAALPGMILNCGVYGIGEPTHFSITFNEDEESHWAVKLIGADGSQSEVKGYPQ